MELRKTGKRVVCEDGMWFDELEPGYDGKILVSGFSFGGRGQVFPVIGKRYSNVVIARSDGRGWGPESKYWYVGDVYLDISYRGCPMQYKER